MTQLGILTRAAALTMALALAATSTRAEPSLWRKEPYDRGQIVTLQGQVTDATGRGLGGVTVLLELSRHAFRIKKLQRETGNQLQKTTVADAEGRYRIDWHWDPFYNRFALSVALPLSRGGGAEELEVFLRQDVTDRVLESNPAEVALVPPASAALIDLREFLDSLDSDDAKRIYEEMGRPDRVDTARAHYDPDRSWWYFAAGKVYRFRDGKLDEVVTFEPVTPQL